MDDLISVTDFAFQSLVAFWNLFSSHLIFSIVLLLLFIPKFAKVIQKIIR